MTLSGMYIDLKEALPCRIDSTEDQVIESILTIDEGDAVRKVRAFREKYVPYDGNASKAVVDAIVARV